MSNGSSNSSCSSSSATNPASRSDGGLGGGGIMSSSNYTPPTLVPYYFGRLLREESNRVLEKQGAAEGLFLLRELVIECGSYALSICSGGVCHHYKIERCDDGFVKIEKGRKFIGPVELVKHHQFELDGLLVKPLVPCIRPPGTQPINYLFINDAEFYKLVDDEIKSHMSRVKATRSLTQAQYNQELAEARGRFRYKYERIVLKTLHFSQPWFRKNLDRDEANELLMRSGLENGKFLVRSNSAANNPSTDAYKISLCYNNEIKHYKIKTNKSASNDDNSVRYCFEGGLEFESVTQLVDYYHRCADGLAYTLRTPFIPATRIDPVLLSFLAGSANSATTAAALNGNDQPLMVQKSANLPPTGASTILHIGSSAVNAVNKRINKMLNNEGIYDSNRMYEVIMNNRSDNNNNTHSDFTNNETHMVKSSRIKSNTSSPSGREQQQTENTSSSRQQHHLSSTETNSSSQRMTTTPMGGGIPYVDDEPNNPSDVTNLLGIPEPKRSLFANEENYEYGSLPTHTINPRDLVFYDKLGSGCFGCVHRGTYKCRQLGTRLVHEIPVAIKQLNIDSDESKREISKEAELMRSLNNPYIIKFIGMCFHQNGSLMIVLELAKLGPLHKYLRVHKEMSMMRICKICYQVALAMQYLASKNLVHRDLAARNVLLVSEDLAKVSDFGMSRRMGENKYYETHSQGKWPLKWYPPDATSSGKFDEKSDVWSFGVTCWEATSYGGRPYQGIDIAMLLIKLENGHRLEKPPACPDEFYNVMYKCWHGSKHLRPTFKSIVNELKQVIYDLYQIDLS